jgi:hypothetical protein
MEIDKLKKKEQLIVLLNKSFLINETIGMSVIKLLLLLITHAGKLISAVVRKASK